VPFTWVFRLNPLNIKNGHFLHKARCCLPGSRQEPFVDFDPSIKYAPVAAHEVFRILASYTAAMNLEPEGADTFKCLLLWKVGHTQFRALTHKLFNETSRSWPYSPLAEIIYGALQSGLIWGSLQSDALPQWDFVISRINANLYFLARCTGFLIMATAVDDLTFTLKDPAMLPN